jgi:PKD repeat protein
VADASGSTDPSGLSIVQIFVNFGDGTTVLANSDGQASHTYQNGGTYTVTVVVFDSDHNSSSASAQVTVS